jgi:hypothetical protein
MRRNVVTVCLSNRPDGVQAKKKTFCCQLQAVLWIRILMFLGLPDPDIKQKSKKNLAPAPNLSINRQKIEEKNLDFY